MQYVYRLLTLVILLTATGFSQQASDYFPAQLGYKWNYRQVPLDSLNNPMETLTFYRVDSFAVVADYENKLADIVLTKEGPQNTINVMPFTDSLFYNFEGTDGYEFLQVGNLDTILAGFDSLFTDTLFSFLDFFRSFEGWYSTYRFAAPVGDDYTLLSVDTTVTIDSTEVPLRFKQVGTRLQDETLETEIGTFDCKKFLLERGVYLLIIFPPPIPEIEVPLIVIGDTLWIAPGNWRVKEIIPATIVDLTLIGGNSFFFPGLQSNIISSITSVEDEKLQPEVFSLSQNYPNPFNPSTKIKFAIQPAGTSIMKLVQLKVYDVLGNEVAVLVNRALPPGVYEVEFDAETLTSGVYFYQLNVGTFVDTKKMILLR